jgi:hypothetical protein
LLLHLKDQGAEFEVEIQVGDEDNPVTDLFDLSFWLNYTDTEIIETKFEGSSQVTS